MSKKDTEFSLTKEILPANWTVGVHSTGVRSFRVHLAAHRDVVHSEFRRAFRVSCSSSGWISSSSGNPSSKLRFRCNTHRSSHGHITQRPADPCRAAQGSGACEEHATAPIDISLELENSPADERSRANEKALFATYTTRPPDETRLRYHQPVRATRGTSKYIEAVCERGSRREDYWVESPTTKTSRSQDEARLTRRRETARGARRNLPKVNERGAPCERIRVAEGGGLASYRKAPHAANCWSTKRRLNATIAGTKIHFVMSPYLLDTTLSRILHGSAVWSW